MDAQDRMKLEEIGGDLRHALYIIAEMVNDHPEDRLIIENMGLKDIYNSLAEAHRSIYGIIPQEVA